MALRSVDQLGMDEITIEDHALESMLEDREKKKASLSAVRAAFDTADKLAKAELEKRDDLPDEAAARVGRFRIERTMSKSRAVSFETQPKLRFVIGVVDD